MTLAQHCQSLNTLEVASCSQFTDAGFQALARVWSKQTHNYAIKCQICSGTHWLISFIGAELPFNGENGSGGVLFDNGRHNNSFSHELCSPWETSECWNRTQDSKKFNWMLFSQSLSHCELITDEGIRHLSTSQCAAENLTALELDNCPFITDASLDHLISCYNLQRIELYDCQLITRAGIRRLRVRLR